MRDKGRCPCPRCKTTFDDIPALGTSADRERRVKAVRQDMAEREARVAEARRIIYEEHYVVNSPRVEELLQPESLVPTEVCLHLCLDVDTVVI